MKFLRILRLNYFKKQHEINRRIIIYSIQFITLSAIYYRFYLLFIMMAFVNLINSALPVKRYDPFGKNSLMFSTIPYYLFSIVVLTGSSLLWDDAWLLMFIIYGMLPYLDEIFSHDLRNPNQQQRKQLEKNDFTFKLALYISMIIDWRLCMQVMNYFKSIDLSTVNVINFAGLLFAFSNLQSVQFAIAHEIFHKQGAFHRILGTLHMSKNLYMHFTYEHLYSHHRKVATPQDTATSRKGETFYQFFPRTFFGSIKNVYKMQKEEENKPFYTNYAVLSILSAVLFTLDIYYIYNIQATILFLITQFGGIVYLEAINYIEHYGLERRKLPNGQYEKVTIRHSWNAPHRFSNYILFKLQRHSDHHENSLKPYQTLLSLDQSPHLPHGYILMIILQFFPQSWFEIMDPLVEEYKRVGVGNIKTEVNERAIQLSKQFGIKIAITMFSLWIASELAQCF